MSLSVSILQKSDAELGHWIDELDSLASDELDTLFPPEETELPPSQADTTKAHAALSDADDWSRWGLPADSHAVASPFANDLPESALAAIAREAVPGSAGVLSATLPAQQLAASNDPLLDFSSAAAPARTPFGKHPLVTSLIGVVALFAGALAADHAWFQSGEPLAGTRMAERLLSRLRPAAAGTDAATAAATGAAARTTTPGAATPPAPVMSAAAPQATREPSWLAQLASTGLPVQPRLPMIERTAADEDAARLEADPPASPRPAARFDPRGSTAPGEAAVAVASRALPPSASTVPPTAPTLSNIAATSTLSNGATLAAPPTVAAAPPAVDAPNADRLAVESAAGGAAKDCPAALVALSLCAR